MSSVDGNQLDARAALEEELATRSTAEIIIEVISVIVIGLIGFCGNLLIVMVIFKTSSLTTTSNYYIVSLSVIDWFISLLTLLFVPVVGIEGSWPFSASACQFQGFATAMLATASIYTMTLISVNRYFVMFTLNLHRTRFTKKNVCISIVSAWILASNFPLSYVLQGHRFYFHPGKAICIFDVSKLKILHAALTALLNVLCPYMIISFCYFKIYLKLKRHNAQLRHQVGSPVSRNAPRRISVKEIRITKILFAIILAFTVCWFPFVIINVLGLVYGPFFAPRQVYVFYSFMAGSSASFSPIIYGTLNKDVRREIIKLLKKLQCSSKITPIVNHGRPLGNLGPWWGGLLMFTVPTLGSEIITTRSPTGAQSWFLVVPYQVKFGKQKYQKVSKHKRKRLWFTTFLQCEKKLLWYFFTVISLA